MVVGEVRGRVGRDEAGGRERMGGGRSMGQAIAVDCGLWLVFFLGWEGFSGAMKRENSHEGDEEARADYVTV
jgi:hypothetical protein